MAELKPSLLIAWRHIALMTLSLAPTCFIAPPAEAMSASFSWHGIAPCTHVSPAFTLKDVPAGATRLRFVMHDRDAPHFHHGGSTIAYSGPHVPQGAITYIGPCPPEGQRHHYIWTIEALNAAGHVLAKTTVAGVFPPG